jgi:hypothetical protein
VGSRALVHAICVPVRLLDGELVAFTPEGWPELPRQLRRHGLTEGTRFHEPGAGVRCSTWCSICSTARLVKQFPGKATETTVADHEDLICDDLGRLDGIVADYPTGSPVYANGRSFPVDRWPKREETIESLSAVMGCPDGKDAV